MVPFLGPRVGEQDEHTPKTGCGKLLYQFTCVDRP
jgi:hypothetical protein